MRPLFLMPAVVVILSTCAPISEEACRGGDWRGIGASDGARGLPTSTVGKYAETCAEFGVTPDLVAYQAGRSIGLQTYCTPSKAYSEGRNGRRIKPVCSADAELTMTPAHRFGLRYFDISEDMDRIRDRIDTREQLLASQFTGTLTQAQEIEAASIRAEIRGLDSDLFRLRIQRRRYDRWPP